MLQVSRPLSALHIVDQQDLAAALQNSGSLVVMTLLTYSGLKAGCGLRNLPWPAGADQVTLSRDVGSTPTLGIFFCPSLLLAVVAFCR